MPEPVTAEMAAEIAKRAAAEKGYPWIEPTSVTAREGEFLVSSNAGTLGGNVLVMVDAASGEVRSINAYSR